MQVVSLRRIEEGISTTVKRRKHFYIVPVMTIFAVIIAFFSVAVFAKIHAQPVQAYHPNVASYAPETSTDSLIFYPDNILPSNNHSKNFMAEQFMKALPMPTTDCIKFDCVALTFDDGPNTQSTAKILSVLENYNIRATFFEIGNQIRGNESLIKRIQQGGSEAGNHSWSHPSFFNLTPKQINRQINDTQTALQAAGVESPNLIRPPYGDFKLDMASSINHAIILWNTDPKDWAYKDPGKIASKLRKVIKPGAIIVMHDKIVTAQALQLVIKDLSSRYRFVTVTELLNLKPDSRGVYIGR